MLRHFVPLRARAPHVVLGLAANATETQIKDKYKELARRLHPDMPGGSEKKFQELNAAYNILKLRVQARSGTTAESSRGARSMGRYRGENDFGQDDEGAEKTSKYRTYVDEEEAAELRAQDRAAEEMRRMQSQTFGQMMWHLSTYEVLMSLGALVVSVLLSFHRHLDVTVGDRIDFSEVTSSSGEYNEDGSDSGSSLKFNKKIELTEHQKLVRDTYRESTSQRTQTSHTKYYHLREILMIYDSERAEARKIEAKPVPAERVDEDRLISESPVVARIDATSAVTPFQNISLKLKEKVAAMPWQHVDVGPAIVLMLEGCRRVPKNDPANYRITTIEYRHDPDGAFAAQQAALADKQQQDAENIMLHNNNNNTGNQTLESSSSSSSDGKLSLRERTKGVLTSKHNKNSNITSNHPNSLTAKAAAGIFGDVTNTVKDATGISLAASTAPRVVVTIINDKFKPNQGRCQRIVISGFDKLHPELIAKRREQLRTGNVKEEELKLLETVFPINDEGIQFTTDPKQDLRMLLYEPPITFEKTKL